MVHSDTPCKHISTLCSPFSYKKQHSKTIETLHARLCCLFMRPQQAFSIGPLKTCSLGKRLPISAGPAQTAVTQPSQGPRRATLFRQQATVTGTNH